MDPPQFARLRDTDRPSARQGIVFGPRNNSNSINNDSEDSENIPIDHLYARAAIPTFGIEEPAFYQPNGTSEFHGGYKPTPPMAIPYSLASPTTGPNRQQQQQQEMSTSLGEASWQDNGYRASYGQQATYGKSLDGSLSKRRSLSELSNSIDGTHSRPLYYHQHDSHVIPMQCNEEPPTTRQNFYIGNDPVVVNPAPQVSRLMPDLQHITSVSQNKARNNLHALQAEQNQGVAAAATAARSPTHRQLPSIEVLIANSKNKLPKNHHNALVNDNFRMIAPDDGQFDIQLSRSPGPARRLPRPTTSGLLDSRVPAEHRHQLINQSGLPASSSKTVLQSNNQHRKLPSITPLGPRPIVRENATSFTRARNVSENGSLSGAESLSIGSHQSATGSLTSANLNCVGALDTVAHQKMHTSSSNESNNRAPSQQVAGARPHPYPRQSQQYFQPPIHPMNKNALTANSGEQLHRKLPTITQQGVLRLRDSDQSQQVFGQRIKAPFGQRHNSSSSGGSSSTRNAAVVRGAFRQYKENEVSMDEDQSDGLDLYHDDRERSESTIGNDMNDDSTSVEKDTDGGSEADDAGYDEHDDDLKSGADDEEEKSVQEIQVEYYDDDDNGVYADEEDDVVPDGPDYFDSSNLHADTDDGEGEYFSALATVPEEDGKLSDRENTNDNELRGDKRLISRYDDGVQDWNGINPAENRYNLESGGTTLIGNQGISFDAPKLSDDNSMLEPSVPVGSNKKLPTIVENGFEAQVMEYLAGKTGIRRNELFSVDEEPSSYNEDADSRGSTNLDQTVGTGDGPLKDQADRKSFAMINDAASNQVDKVMATEAGAEAGQYEQDRVVYETDVRPMGENDLMNGPKPSDERSHEQQQEQSKGENYDNYLAEDRAIAYEDLGDGDLADEQILMSPNHVNKTSLEQEEYDEQYRDINNPGDLDRRATNHVHAIDGHSKSMLNDIHQQQTIVDYFDDAEFVSAINNDSSEQVAIKDNGALPVAANGLQPNGAPYLGNLNSLDQPNTAIKMDGLAIDRREYDQKAQDQLDNRLEDTNNFTGDKLGADGQHLALEPALTDEQLYNQRRQYEQQDSSEQAHEHELERDSYDLRSGEEAGNESTVPDELGFESDLPRARIRWITAVNKIVNRSNGVTVSLTWCIS